MPSWKQFTEKLNPMEEKQMNKVFLIGNLAKDPELSETSSRSTAPMQARKGKGKLIFSNVLHGAPWLPH